MSALRLLALFTLTCTRALFTLYSLLLVLGPSALGKGEHFRWQWKFKELTLH